MKPNLMRWMPVLLLAGSTLFAGVPLPTVTYYGCVRNAYGYPYAKDAEVVFSQGTNEYVRYRVTGERRPGVNYRLDLEMDSGGVPYEAYAAHVGDVLNVKVYYLGQSIAVMTNAIISASAELTVPAAGTTVRIDIQTGADTDRDGLPDTWEQMLIAQSGGALQTLAEVNPDDDFDGDGSSNRHEFQSGTFPFLADDCFKLENLERQENGRFKFRFLAVVGFTYQISGATNLTGAVWVDQPFATAPAAAAATGYVYGDDTFKTLYVDATNTASFVRLSIK